MELDESVRAVASPEPFGDAGRGFNAGQEVVSRGPSPPLADRKVGSRHRLGPPRVAVAH